jgi:hypothetical protein
VCQKKCCLPGPGAFNIAQLKPALVPPHVHFERSTCAAREGTYVQWTEVISPGDPRASLFDQAKKDELLDLIRRGTFDVVLEEEAISNADGPLNVLPCKFVLAIKHRDNGEDVLKARFVIGGHRDREKDFLVHTTTTIRHQSVRLLLALAASLGHEVWTIDAKHAYLQSAAQLDRDVFIKHGALHLQAGELGKLLRLLNVLADSGDF